MRYLHFEIEDNGDEVRVILYKGGEFIAASVAWRTVADGDIMPMIYASHAVIKAKYHIVQNPDCVAPL